MEEQFDPRDLQKIIEDAFSLKTEGAEAFIHPHAWPVQFVVILEPSTNPEEVIKKIKDCFKEGGFSIDHEASGTFVMMPDGEKQNEWWVVIITVATVEQESKILVSANNLS